MCLNCGCGEPEKRHQPTDITQEDLQRAADGSGMTLRQAARNVSTSSNELAGGTNGGQQPNGETWTTGTAS
jgi:DNA transposition AAA+ family ATPase